MAERAIHDAIIELVQRIADEQRIYVVGLEVHWFDGRVARINIETACDGPVKT